MKGLTTAPLTAGDATAVASMWHACELHDDGKALVTEEDFVTLVRRPSLDFRRDTMAVRDGDAIVAAAFLFGDRFVFANVAPSHRGRGVGAWLLRWSEDAGRAAGKDRSCQKLSENQHAAIALLEGAGYERTWEDWVFDIELEREPAPPALPPGYAIRPFVRERDDRDVHRVIEGAFAEWPDPEPEAFDDWAAEVFGRPSFVPEHIGVVVRDDEIAGAALLIEEEDLWVAQLAVARAHRGRGLGRALLVHAFRCAWRSGRRHVGLATDGRTGARGLYEHVGMRVTRTAWEYSKSL